MPKSKQTLCIVGLGYVGLPLAHAFAKKGFTILGYDIQEDRILELQSGKDRTNELSTKELKSANIEFSSDPSVIKKADVVILAIPTPVDADNNPDLSLLKNATETVAKNVQEGAIVVYESTVYPGVTEEICGPILKKEKSVKLGYSPERMNPGDKEHTVEKIVKVVAGEDEETANILMEMYGAIAPVHRAQSIKVAEMAKAIENAQRDLNIAYINEIAMLCNALDISSKDVFDAAKTKWNFLNFSPGLVGGHCIGVDPYYLLKAAQDKGIISNMISAARKTNDGIAHYITQSQILPRLREKKDISVLILGTTFKENVPDTRNSKSNDIVTEFKKEGISVSMHDAQVDDNDALEKENSYDAILLLVPHKEYLTMTPEEFAKTAKEGCIFFDLKSVFNAKEMEKAGFTYLAL
jgi:UDP-N-acetyl-D-glucosamine/UDP-N-acetyl-D-galactosamine dehydrogenase